MEYGVLNKVYHVIIKGIYFLDIFKSGQCKILFLSILNNALKKYNSSLYAYVVMDTHVHLLIKTSHLRLLLQMLSTRYARVFNKLKNRNGKVFFHSTVYYEKEITTWQIDSLLYILNNPIEARICKCHKNYIYSSYRQHIGMTSSLNTIIKVDNSLIKTNFKNLKDFKEALKDKLKYQQSVAHIKYRFHAANEFEEASPLCANTTKPSLSTI